MIYRVPPPMLEDLWPAVEPHAKRALKRHPFIDSADLLLICLSGRAQCFVATDESGLQGFAVVEVRVYPRMQVANILAAGGRLGFFQVLTGPMWEEMQRFGREQDATVISWQGRLGWERVVRGHGFHVIETALVWKETPDEHGRRNNEDHDNPVGPGTTLSPAGDAGSGRSRESAGDYVGNGRQSPHGRTH